MPCHSERSEESENTNYAFQILRDAQDDNVIGEIHYDTPSLTCETLANY